MPGKGFYMKIIQGNLLDLAEAGEFDIIVQGCNCFCTQGHGLARQIRERYPQAYEVDRMTRKGDRNKLGEFSVAAADNFVIVNAYTQYDYNRSGERRDVFEYEAFERVLENLYDRMTWGGVPRRFGFPAIGQGLAGGDPVRIRAQLEKFAQKVEAAGGTVTLVEYHE